MKMGKKVREYKSGDFIFAKVKGYPAWPARVQRQNGKKYFVYFYGTGETANLPPNMIFDYSENKDKFLNKSVKRKDFNDGVRQIEHDFANNVPLEEVVGALAAEAPPPAADDTLPDAADSGADDSALADSTADDTRDESNDAPVDDSDDAGALVIDEGKAKGRKSTAKPPATPKAKEAKTPRGRPKKEDAKEAKEPEPEEERREEEIISRSGRKIRPKRYMDEQVEEPAQPSPAAKKRRGASPAADRPEPKEKPQDKNIKAYNTVQQSELRELKEPFKSADSEKENILITYLPSGQVCGVRLFQSRPASFKSEASRLQWDKQAASNAITLKRQLEKGQITPQSISAQLVMDLNLTEDEKKALDKDRDLEVKKARLHFLKTEMKLIELDAKIKTCLSLEKADTELCLKLIDEILELDLAALMLLKHPTCMETVKRMRVYVGNTPSWEMSESDALSFSKQAHRIRNKADALFITMRDLFDVPEGVTFWEYFNERVALFKSVTDTLHADKLLEMVHEPIEMSQPTPHTMKAAVEAADEQEAADEDPDKKKKATPAKGKKANSTPLKQPLKRQSSRKQQQEDKEKETEPETPTEDIPEEPDTNKPNDTDKTDSETPKENDKSPTVNDKSDEDKPNENEPDDADREVEKVNENSDKNKEKEPETDKADDNEKEKDAAKGKESDSKGKGDHIESKPNDSKDKTDEKESDGKEKSSKDSKKKDSDKTNSDKSKDNGKSKDKSKDDKANEKKDDAKNGKEKAAKAGEKRREKGSDKEKSEEKEKVEVDEPRAKRSRESKKTEPPPRSPAKRKSKS